MPAEAALEGVGVRVDEAREEGARRQPLDRRAARERLRRDDAGHPPLAQAHGEPGAEGTFGIEEVGE